MNRVIIEESDNRYKLIIDDEELKANQTFWSMPSISKLHKLFSSKPIKDVENLTWHFENTKDIYGSTVRLLRDIIKQINYLEKNNLGFLYLSLDDIIVYYDTFFFVNANNLYPLIEDNSSLLKQIEITAPYTVEDKDKAFLSPEISQNNEIPIMFKQTCCYYSFGKIVKELVKKYNIKATSIDHFIKRATREDETLRQLHFI